MILPKDRAHLCASSLLILFLLLFAQPLHAASYTWSGATGANWNDQSQWLLNGTLPNNGFPGPGDTAIVNAGQVNEAATPRTVATLTLGGGTVNFTTVDLTVTSTLTINSGTLTGSGNTSIPGSFVWNGGTLSGTGTTTVSATGSFTLNPAGPGAFLSQRILTTNATTATWPGAGILQINTNGVFNNNGTLDNTTNSTLQFANGTFNNGGTLKKSAGTLTTRFVLGGGAGNFINTGIVLAETGTILFACSGGSNGGTHTAGTGATIAFNVGTQNFTAASHIEGAGSIIFSGTVATIACPISSDTFTGSMNVTGGQASFNATDNSVKFLLVSGTGTLSGGGTVNVLNGFTWNSNSTMSGTGLTNVASSATALLSPTATLTLSQRALILGGFTTWQQNSPIAITNNATLTNDGVLDSQSDGTIQFNLPLGGTFNNNGTFKKSSGTGFTHISDNTAAGLFNTFGDVQALAGTLDFSTTFTQFSGSSLLNGGTLQGNPLTFQGGTLTGTGTVNGSVDNQNGVVEPGGSLAAGAITITDSYGQASGGSLYIELGGTTPGSQFDRLNIGNTANLNGSLAVALINGFSPTPAMSFTCVTYDVLNGAFASYSAGGTMFQPQYNQRDLTLIFAQIDIVFFDGTTESTVKTWNLPGSELDKVYFSLDTGLSVNVKNKGAYSVKVHVSILNGAPWVSEEKGRFSAAKDLYYITLLGDHPPPDVDLPGTFPLGTGGSFPNTRNGALEMRTPITSTTNAPAAIVLRFVAAYD